MTCHILASTVGITLGIVAATRQYSWVDTLFGFVAFLGMTIPRFLMALVIIYILAFKLNVQELGNFFSPNYSIAPWSWGKFVNLVQHVWPVVFIATFGGLAYNMRVMRGNLLDVLNAQQALVNARVALVTAQHDRVVASYAVLSAIGRLSPQVLNLPTTTYDPSIHYQQVRDSWFGVRTPDGR